MLSFFFLRCYLSFSECLFPFSLHTIKYELWQRHALPFSSSLLRPVVSVDDNNDAESPAPSRRPSPPLTIPEMKAGSSPSLLSPRYSLALFLPVLDAFRDHLLFSSSDLVLRSISLHSAFSERKFCFRRVDFSSSVQICLRLCCDRSCFRV